MATTRAAARLPLMMIDAAQNRPATIGTQRCRRGVAW